MMLDKRLFKCHECEMYFKTGYELGGHVMAKHRAHDGNNRNGPDPLTKKEYRIVDKETRRLEKLYKKL